jgi:glycosyltransferase involved in cell wall biosynthesis
MNAGVLIVFHTPTNAGYAMTALEKMFFSVCAAITGDPKKVHFSFTDISSGKPKSLSADFDRYIHLDYKDNGTFLAAQQYIKENHIQYALCFDLQPRAVLCDFLRSSGVKKMVSYWGSTISSRNNPIKLLLKRLDVLVSKNKPNHFIFESEAMRQLAVYGRGILKKDTSVIPTGVDTEKFKPDPDGAEYVRKEFNLLKSAKIVFYSGHMEERKGVRVIIQAAIHVAQYNPEIPLYFLICGNLPGEEKPFIDMLRGTAAESRVIFAGYRHDLPQIMPGCSIGVVASTGWDSFPMSTLEMAASGLPIVVSRLQGLSETLEDNVTGYTFEPGNSKELAQKLVNLCTNDNTHRNFSNSAVRRIESSYTLKTQFDNLLKCLQLIFDN